jgi:simple sugar transport system permease protein
VIQRTPGTTINITLLNMAPWILMIATLILVSSGALERLLRLLPGSLQKSARNLLRSAPPAALGTRFERQ